MTVPRQVLGLLTDRSRQTTAKGQDLTVQNCFEVVGYEGDIEAGPVAKIKALLGTDISGCQLSNL